MGPYSIGVDLGGTNLRAASYSSHEGLRFMHAVPTRVAAGPLAVVEDLVALVRTIREKVGLNRELLGVCVVAPGPLELPAGRFHQPPNLQGWDGFSLRQALTDRLDVPIYLQNDANAAALAEYHLGAGKLSKPKLLCMLTLGTGVGSGFVLDGHIFEGVHGLAGEAGHITVDPSGTLCGCGNVGCLETLASALSLVQRAKRHPQWSKLLNVKTNAGGDDQLTARHISSAALEGNVTAIALFQETGTALGIAIASLINILDPEMIAIAGGLADAWPLFCDRMIEEVRQRSYIFRLMETDRPIARPIRIVKAQLGADSGLLGAAIQVFIELNLNRREGNQVGAGR